VDCSKNGQDFEELLEKVAHARIVEVILKGDCGLDEPIIWTIERDDVWVSGREDDEDPCPDPLPTINGMIVLQYANRVTLDCLKVTGPYNGVVAFGSNFWIHNSEISGNGGTGLALNSSNVELINVHVDLNWVGINLERNSNAVIPEISDTSTITNNTSYGIWIQSHSFVQVDNATIQNNGGGSEIQLSRDAGLVLGSGATVNLDGFGYAYYCTDYMESSVDPGGAAVSPPAHCSGFD
jgi:hypothetical protein